MDNSAIDLIPQKQYSLKVELNESPKDIAKRLVLNSLLVASLAIRDKRSIKEAVEKGIIEEADETAICVRILSSKNYNPEELPFNLKAAFSGKLKSLTFEDYADLSERFCIAREWLEGEDF